MQRVTMTFGDDLIAALAGYMDAAGYSSRSEAMRDLMRFRLQAAGAERPGDARAAAVPSYVYDHGMRDLARRLTLAQHDHHELPVATAHVHLGHETCLEAQPPSGAATALQRFAEGVLAERGVRHGHLHHLSADGYARRPFPCALTRSGERSGRSGTSAFPGRGWRAEPASMKQAPTPASPFHKCC